MYEEPNVLSYILLRILVVALHVIVYVYIDGSRIGERSRSLDTEGHFFRSHDTNSNFSLLLKAI